MQFQRNPQNGRLATPCVGCGAIMYVWPSESLRKFCDRACYHWYLGTAAALHERLWRLVDRSGGADQCWPFRGGRGSNGYGRLAKNGGGYVYTHRLAWTATHGAIAAGMGVLHRCDNPPCCNPAHLFLGTQAENSRDMNAKGRGAWQRPGHVQKAASFTPRGIFHHATKLTATDVPVIRARAAAGEPLGRLAREYGVHRVTLRDVVRRVSWKHVP
jgi:hypothetical protein